MNRFTWNWNLLHYYVYLWQKRAYEILDYFLPTTWVLKIPAVKEAYKKRTGIDDIHKHITKITDGNEKAGLNIIWAGISMGGILVFLVFGAFNFFQVLLGKSLIQYVWGDAIALYKIIFLILLLFPQGIINYFVLFRNDRYLIYFKEFNKMPLSLKRLYGWRCFSCCITIFVFFVGSFFALSYSLK